MPLKPNSKYQFYIEFLIFEPITVILNFHFHLFSKVSGWIKSTTFALFKVFLREAIFKTAEDKTVKMVSLRRKIIVMKLTFLIASNNCLAVF